MKLKQLQAHCQRICQHFGLHSEEIYVARHHFSSSTRKNRTETIWQVRRQTEEGSDLLFESVNSPKMIDAFLQGVESGYNIESK